MSADQFPVTDEMRTFFLKELDKFGIADSARLLTLLKTKFEYDSVVAAFTLVELAINQVVRVDRDESNQWIVKRGSMTLQEIQALVDRVKNNPS